MFYCVHEYKDAMLGRFYAICNCCSCCLSHLLLASLCQRRVPSVAEGLESDAGATKRHADVCQFAGISVDDGFARIDASACMGCGV
jgi:hypothetical protein